MVVEGEMDIRRRMPLRDRNIMATSSEEECRPSKGEVGEVVELLLCKDHRLPMADEAGMICEENSIHEVEGRIEVTQILVLGVVGADLVLLIVLSPLIQVVSVSNLHINALC